MIKDILFEGNFLFCQYEKNMLSCLHYPSQDKISEVLSQLPLKKLIVKNWDEIGLTFDRALTQNEFNKLLEELKPSNESELRIYSSKNDKFNLNWIK